MRPSLDPQADRRASLLCTELEVTGRTLRGSTAAVIPASASNATTMDCAKSDVFTYTPTEATTITPINLTPGQEITINFLTSGSSSFVITFGAPFKTTGTLTSGTTTAKYFIMKFVSDGTNLYEISRTAAM